MADKNPYFDIIQTKLFRPAVVADFIPRTRLNKLLDRGEGCRLTLVSAQAGYGKSQLISSWLESSDRLSCWVSLDEEMNDLVFFLQYILSAIRKLFPEACRNTLALTNASEPQSPQVISSEFINELMEITAPFVIVLDDYGFIHNQDIHNLLIEVCKFAPQTLQMVILTRRDPPLPLHSYRAQANLVELRQSNLQFTLEETCDFLKRSGNISLDKRSSEFIHEKVEGWATGLRLLVISLQGRNDLDDFLREMKGDSRHVQEYLMAEVLSRQSSTMREGLLKTSILGRFCASLYSTLCHAGCKEECGPECNGQLFIRQLEASNLFIVTLDEQGKWYRYHHLFQQLLNRTLENRYSHDEIKELHHLARNWFEQHGLLDESFHHALVTTDYDSAAKIIIHHRKKIVEEEQWGRLGWMLNKLPKAVVEKNPELLILHGRSLDKRGLYTEHDQVITRAEKLLESLPDKGKDYRRWKGEVLVMRSALSYHLSQPQKAIKAAEMAFKLLPSDLYSERVYAVLINVLAHQMIGKQQHAYTIIHDALQKEAGKSSTFHGRLLQTLCFLQWIDADMNSLKQTANALLELCSTHELPESKVHAHYFLGAAQYQLNEIDAIDQILKPVIENPIGPSFYMYLLSAQVLSFTYDILGRQEDARTLSDSLVTMILNGRGTSFLANAKTHRAELALRQGFQSLAVNGIKEIQIGKTPPGYHFIIPELLIAKILLSQKKSDCLKQAEGILRAMCDHFTAIHNTRFLVEVFALQALLQEALGNVQAADKKLAEALMLAEPGGMVRIFVDLGTVMEKLLDRQSSESPHAEYILKLKNAFTENGSEKGWNNKSFHTSVLPSNPLTNREQEILELFARRLSNQEIAEKLCIADNTVKRHATNIFRKLDVKNRRKAVEQAYHLGITS